MLFGKNIEARQSFHDAMRLNPEMSTAHACELKYALAKLQRKFRLYQEARTIFKSLITCPAETLQKARYMDLMLASMTGDLSEPELFDSFVADYPTHILSDDVLLFKANLFLDKGDNTQALEILQKLTELFPDGDMIARALFLRAFVYAREAQPEKALVLLKKLTKKSSSDTIAHAQANYWTARLMVFPDINKFEKPQNKNIKKAKVILNDLINSSEPNVYSWLAYELLYLVENKLIAPKKPSNIFFEEKKIITQNKHLEFINLLIEHDFKKEALALLDQEPLNHDNSRDLGAIAQAYINLGRPELGHQKLIKCDENKAAQLKKAWPKLYAQISGLKLL